jgi:hypothetical protein
MRWIDEAKANNPKRVLHVLLPELGEPLASAFVEYWKRILTEGAVLPRGSRETVGFEILARDGDDVGTATANFYNSLHQENNDAAQYILRSDDLVCIRGRDEDRRSFTRTHFVWQLKQYVALKQALHHPDVWPLFENITASGPLGVRAAGPYGWFDLQPGQKAFGALSASDQSALAGQKPTMQDAVADLCAGVVDLPE